MPLVKATLSAGIIKALEKAAALDKESDDPKKALKDIAEDLAQTIDTYIRAATVITPAGPGSLQ